MRLNFVEPRHARHGSILAVVVAAFVLGLGGGASAQIQTDEFSANRFSPAPGAGNYFMVDGAAVGGHLTPSLGLFIDYAHRPFVIYDAPCEGGDEDECSVEDSTAEIVSYQLTFNAMGSLTLFQRLQIGLLVPVVATSGEPFRSSVSGSGQPFIDVPGGDSFGLGDPRLSAKVRIVGTGADGFTLAAAAYVGFPLGQATAEGSNIGDDGLTFGGHLIGELRLDMLSLSANAGGVYRPTSTFLSTEIGPEITYGVGGALQITSLLRAIGEVTGATQFTNQLDENPIEARAGAELTVNDFAVLLGGGVGILSGVGVPVFRVLAGVAYRPAGLDSDGDGVPDKDDSCPTEGEDKDGYLDDDGCPEVDNDSDGILDTNDRCVSAPEDADGVDDADGCPDTDNDADGIQDGYDSCPAEPEDKDGDRDDDGCPEDDRDRDGVGDAADKCPDNPEDTDGFGDDDGCPETDFDGDGVPDDEDSCADQAETVNGKEDEDGCPELSTELPPPPPPPTEIRVTCDKIEFPGKVQYKSGSDVIQARSHDLLLQIAEVMRTAKHIKKIRIEGHTDDSGAEAANLKLSDKRAASVKKFLLEAGIEEARLVSQGFGEGSPLTENKTKAGREANRRVEFMIAEQDKQPGCK
jgi:outer membrane protein OmpA-like peptidoglycan-associated protein